MAGQQGWSWTDSRRSAVDLLGALENNWDTEDLLWERKMWAARIEECSTLADLQLNLLENPPDDIGAAWTCLIANLAGTLEENLKAHLGAQARADEAEGASGKALLLDRACELSWTGCAGVRTLLGKHPGAESERIRMTAATMGSDDPLAVSWASAMVSAVEDINWLGGSWNDDTGVLAGVCLAENRD